jgi:tRNA-2-methylthio-N6-dimethylallyladenosine synthase
MTYNIITIGCQMNKADSERLAFYLENLGFKSEKNFLKSDLVVLVSCGVKQSAEDRIYGLAHRIMKNNKKTIIALTGCLSDRPDVKSRLAKNVQIYFNISTLPSLNNVLKKYFPKIKKVSNSQIKNYLDLTVKRSSSFSALVPIGNGCNNFCSYCVVPYARGREVYRSSTDIINEVKSLLKEGHKEITLIAQNVNSYKSGQTDFPKLLEKIDKLPGKFWLRFSTSHPKDVSPKLIKVLKNSHNVCEHFHLAVQSGDNKILQAMNRKYKVEDYEKIVEKIRAALRRELPAAITTDIIVGFPGESKANFLNTKKLFQEIKFDLAFISKYSPRYQTASAKLPDDVSLEEKKSREAELNVLLKKNALINNKKYLGKEVEVLLEGVNRRGDFFGRTRTSKIVIVKNNKIPLTGGSKNCSQRRLVGEFVKIKINKIKEFELEGELAAEKPKVIVILGPTSSGKTSLAVQLAHDFSGEIVSADSRQVYKGMDIGTGKDLAEYNYKGQDIPYYLIDVCNPKTIFSLAKYQAMAFKAIDDIVHRDKLPILVGGSGLYLEAVIDNYILSAVKPVFGQRDEYENLSLKELQNKIKKINPKFFANLNNSELNNKRRLARFLEVLLSEKDFSPRKGERLYDFIIFGLKPDRAILRERIYQRLIKRLEEEDMIGEVERLKKLGVSYKRLESFGLEYRYVSYYLQKKITYQQLADKLFIAICQFSKRQMSWFRRMEKMGTKIIWFNDFSEIKSELNNFLK